MADNGHENCDCSGCGCQVGGVCSCGEKCKCGKDCKCGSDCECGKGCDCGADCRANGKSVSDTQENRVKEG